MSFGNLCFFFSEWSLYVTSWPFPYTKFAEHWTSVLCSSRPAMPHARMLQQQDIKHSLSWVTVGQCHHLPPFFSSRTILLTVLVPDYSLQNILLGKNWLWHLSPDTKMLMGPSHASGRAQPDSSDSRRRLWQWISLVSIAQICFCSLQDA